MATQNKLAEAKPGDTLVLRSDSGKRLSLVTVTKVTETQLTCSDGQRYVKNTGKELGVGWLYDTIHHPEEVGNYPDKMTWMQAYEAQEQADRENLLKLPYLMYLAEHSSNFRKFELAALKAAAEALGYKEETHEEA